jgi:hypothetical protein
LNLFLAIVMAIAVAASGRAGDGAQNNAGLRLAIAADQPVIKAGQHVGVIVMLRNLGRNFFFGYQPSPWDQYRFQIDRDGTVLRPTPAPAATLGGPSSAALIGRNEMQWIDLDLTERYDFSRPGTYHIKATARFAPVTSNVITVIVKTNIAVAGSGEIFRLHHARLSGADQIFDAAVNQLRDITYPRYVSFIVEARSFAGSRRYDEAYESLVRTDTNNVVTQARPVWSTNKPENPYGFNINIFGLGKRNNGNVDNPFGTPRISPIYSFGLRRPPGPVLPEEANSPTPERLKLLGRIATIGRNYTIAFAGIENFEGHNTYHLTLLAISDPDTYRIRDMWIDTDSLVIWGLTSDGIFPSGPASKVRWTVIYGNRDGNWVMVEERTTAKMLTGGEVFHWGGKTFDGFTYIFQNFDYPAHEYESTFFDRGPSEAFQE